MSSYFKKMATLKSKWVYDLCKHDLDRISDKQHAIMEEQHAIIKNYAPSAFSSDQGKEHPVYESYSKGLTNF